MTINERMNMSPLNTKVDDINSRLNYRFIRLSYAQEDIREYSIRCEVHSNQSSCGHLTLYYSQKKNRFTMDLRSVKNKEVRHELALHADEIVEKANTKKVVKPPVALNGLYAYVDGSFINNTVAFGAVILHEEKIVAEFSGKVLDPDYQHARQVAGELMAVGKVIQWCKAGNYSHIAIHYDYEGIEHWVTGKWKAKQLLTQRYRDFVLQSGVVVRWIKVAAHTGVYWNEYVDTLAKQAATQ